MKNKTGRIVVIGIVVAWTITAIKINNEKDYQRVLGQQHQNIEFLQSSITYNREMTKHYENEEDFKQPEYRKAVEAISRDEARLETITPIYEANLEYYNSHWLLLRRPIIC